MAPDFGRTDEAEFSIRPARLDDFVGQELVRENLAVFVAAARRAARRWTTRCSTVRRALARPLWRNYRAELGVGFRATSGPVIARAGDLLLVTNLQPQDVCSSTRSTGWILRLRKRSGHGGFSAGPDHRRGAGGALGSDRSAALHLVGADPGRPDHDALRERSAFRCIWISTRSTN